MRHEQLELFPAPGRNPLPRPAGVSVDDAAGPVRYLPYHVKLRRHCDDCVQEAHARGWNKAPRVRQARWKRVGDGDPTAYLCTDHKAARELRNR